LTPGVRRTADGKLLLFLARGKYQSTQKIKESIEKATGDEANVRAVTEDS